MTVTCAECGDVRNIACNSSFCGYWPATVAAMGAIQDLLLDALKDCREGMLAQASADHPSILKADRVIAKVEGRP